MSLRQLWLAVMTLLWTQLAFAGGGGNTPPEPAVDFSGIPDGASARPPGQGDKPHPAIAHLIVEQDVVAPGDTLAVGVHLKQDKDWHTYWKTPGDIGLPTSIELSLPDGLEQGAHHMPVPVRYDQSGMISYGYDNAVLHIVDVPIPEGFAAGTYDVAAHVEWLICKTSCIPGAADLQVQVTVGDATRVGGFGELFAHYRDQWPTGSDAIQVSVAHDAEPILPNESFRTLFHITAAPGHTLTPPKAELWPSYVPITGFEYMVDKAEVVPTKDGFYVHVESTAFEPDPLPTDDAIGGLFQVQVDGKWVRTELSHPMPWASSGPRKPVDMALFTAFDAAKDAMAPAVAEAATAGADDHGADDDHDDDGAVPPPAPETPATAGAYAPAVLFGNLGLAFLGGLILNIMPCVLPVLMLKLYSLIEQGGISDAERRSAGLAYTGGILVSFWLLAAAIFVMRTVFESEVGWGFQMQSPGYVAALATLVFVFSLSLFGVFEIPAFGADSATELGAKEGLGGYFFTGVFATLVATPCSAPILGAAIAFAFSAPTWMLVLSFTMIGLGLAFPFVVIAFVPALFKVLPQPGEWMESFKQLLAFTLVATTVWLVDVLAHLVGPDRTTGFLAFLVTAAIGAWVFGRWGGVAAEARRQATAAAAGIGVMMLGGWAFLDLQYDDTECDDGSLVTNELSFAEHIPWQPFTGDRIDRLSGKVVFVDFTADWCVSCKVNERTILETRTVRDAMAQHGVVPLVGDWTRRDQEISDWLKRFGRAGVPMYLVIPPTGVDDAILLPEVITPGMVVDAIEKAATEQLGKL
jgi:thiol:disulfide interchange protein DsbD